MISAEIPDWSREKKSFSPLEPISLFAGIPELMIPGQNGWLVPAGSVAELSTAMEELLSGSTERLTEMGNAAYVRVTQRHGIDTESGELAALFSEHAA